MLRKMAIMAGLTMALFVPSALDAGDPGMVVLAMGGGSIDDAAFVSGVHDDITFSFFAGFDKHGSFKGHFAFKRVYPGSEYESNGVRAVISSEITDLDWGLDACPWVAMSGVMTLHATWTHQPIRPEYFTVRAWDCDGIDDLPDMIEFGTYRDELFTDMRPALSLDGPTEVTSGNILIR